MIIHLTSKPISDATQTALNGKVDNTRVLTDVPASAKFTDTVYTHPTTAGNKHIPTGGATGQFLKYSASGTAVWAADNNTVTTINGKTGAIVKADITALGIPAQDTVYSHPSSHPASIITESSSRRFASDDEKSTWNTVTSKADKTYADGRFTYTEEYLDYLEDFKADTTYVNDKVKTDVPSGAKFTDTITTINGKTGAIAKADITALGIPAQDTVYTHPATHPASMITDLSTGQKVARFVVGTSTAGWTAADCDYLCDGTADQTEINAAITALPARGGEIVILDGTYNITSEINVTKNNVSIRGNGNATILKRMFNSL